MIDVSQSVEHDHPMALDFLRRDCAVMNDFFRKNNTYVLTTLALFNFITDISITDAESTMDTLLQQA
jgi:RIO kinase 1